MIAKHFFRKIARTMLALISVLGFSASAFAQNGLLGLDHPNLRAVAAVQNAETPKLMATAGILGTAIGQNAAGQGSLLVFVDSTANNVGEVVRGLPPLIRGVPVSVQLTEPFRALAGKPGGGGGGVSHTAKQTPPIQLGTSGGWGNDLANGYCCGGTLGSLVRIGSVQYILSNYHVLEADIVNGGNGGVAMPGDPVIQPGLIDVGCSAPNAQSVAMLAGIKSLPSSNVDAALALVNPGMVRTDGYILEIGTISSQTNSPAVNQAVKKSGRTSGLTRSTIVALNATVSVAYDNECAGGAAFTKTFTGQIMINNRNKGQVFLQGGDSGSLLVQDAATNPKSIGLLFAGSSTYAIANSIGEVLSFLSTQMGGQPVQMVGP